MPCRRKRSRSGPKTASRSVRGGGGATAGSGDQSTTAASGTKRSATPASTGGQPSRWPSVIVTAPDRSTAVRASAVRAPTASPCSERSSTSTAYASMTMSCDADPNAIRSASSGDDRDVGRRAESRERQDRAHQDELADEDPRPAPADRAEPRPEAVHQRRPQELEGPRRLREREEAHGLDVDAPVREEGRQRDPHQAERQPRGERLERHGADAPRGERRASGSPTSPRGRSKTSATSLRSLTAETPL